ncbi:MAG: hypothetical protein JST25_04110 [Actinobacteria bacterium]|nr:hypothetical protein [Actinomycetota bacterium]
MVGTLAVVLLAGILIGWAIPRPPDVGLALRAGELERRDAALKAQDGYDPGSVLLLARADDGLLWFATQARGELLCAILDVRGAAPQSQCVRSEQLDEQPLFVSLPEPVRGHTDGYAGTLTLAGTGVPLGNLQRYRMMYTDSGGQGAEDRAAMRRLVDENGLEYATVVGRVAGAPVWLGQDADGQRCLVLEDPPLKSCEVDATSLDFSPGGTVLGSSGGDDAPTLRLRLPATAAHPAMRVELWSSDTSGQYLVITEDDALFRHGGDAAD